MDNNLENEQVKRYRMMAIGSFSLGVFLFLIGIMMGFSFDLAPALTTLLLGMGCIYLGNSFSQKYATIIKNSLVKEVYSKFFDDVTYDGKAGISKSEVERLNLFTTGSSFVTNDLIKGKYNNIKFSKCDVNTSTTTQSGNNTSTTVIYFSGQVYSFDFPRNLEYYHRVGSKTLSNFVRRINPFRFEKIQFEDSVFNKIFKTVTTNDHEAFLVFTPHFMRKVLDLEYQMREPIAIVLVKNVIYVAVNTSKDMHEPKLFSGADAKYKGDLESSANIIKGIIATLGLENDYLNVDRGLSND